MECMAAFRQHPASDLGAPCSRPTSSAAASASPLSAGGAAESVQRAATPVSYNTAACAATRATTCVGAATSQLANASAHKPSQQPLLLPTAPLIHAGRCGAALQTHLKAKSWIGATKSSVESRACLELVEGFALMLENNSLGTLARMYQRGWTRRAWEESETAQMPATVHHWMSSHSPSHACWKRVSFSYSQSSHHNSLGQLPLLRLGGCWPGPSLVLSELMPAVKVPFD